MKPGISSKLALTALALLVSGCGSQQFNSIATTQMGQAPGTLQIAPKVDVILVEDDTGRIQNQYQQISQQASGFLNTLDQQGWNYHFATVRLTTPLSSTSPTGVITQAVASKQDPNWDASSSGYANLWQAPYPGAQENQVDELEPSIFRTISYIPGFMQYAGEGAFLQSGDATNKEQGQEPGFTTLLQDATTGLNGTNFLRPDAMLAVVMVGTGNDTSYVNYCTRSDGKAFPCETLSNTVCTSLDATQVPYPNGYPAAPAGAPYCQSDALSMKYFVSQIQGLKASSKQIKFYAAVDTDTSQWSRPCLGGEASPGIRYMNMASALDGKSYDVCSQPLSSIFPDIAQNLTTTALNFQKNFVVLQQEPDPTTIQVVKYIGGDTNNPVTIPMDATNGWTYAGYKSNQPLIDYPIAMDYASGYMIELHGSAVLSGSDNAAITYKLPSGQSVSQGQ